MQALMEDDDLWRSRSIAGIDSVVLTHTYAHRLAKIAEAAGFEVGPPGPDYAVVCDANSKMDIDRLVKKSEGLEPRPRELLVAWRGDGLEPEPMSANGGSVRFLAGSDRSDYSSQRQAGEMSSAKWIYRGSLDGNTIRPLLSATVYSAADAVVVASAADQRYVYDATADRPGELIQSQALRGVGAWKGLDGASRAGFRVLGVDALPAEANS